ncbi:hypothetical protein [Lentzea sp. NPDC004782]|uniref:hypothetical protein n=1 Tax=Lentzea sp. NPDC004782 TaxID=3154458 RepID=UPI0033ACFD63
MLLLLVLVLVLVRRVSSLPLLAIGQPHNAEPIPVWWIASPDLLRVRMNVSDTEVPDWTPLFSFVASWVLLGHTRLRWWSASLMVSSNEAARSPRQRKSLRACALWENGQNILHPSPDRSPGWSGT